MAKQINATSKKTKSGVINGTEAPKRIATRSPITNLYIAGILFVIYMAIADQGLERSLLYSVAAFMFFNTVDYCILYYRMKKERN